MKIDAINQFSDIKDDKLLKKVSSPISGFKEELQGLNEAL